MCETERESMLWLTNMSWNMKTHLPVESAIACVQEPLDGYNLTPTLASVGWHGNAGAAITLLVRFKRYPSLILSFCLNVLPKKTIINHHFLIYIINLLSPQLP